MQVYYVTTRNKDAYNENFSLFRPAKMSALNLQSAF